MRKRFTFYLKLQVSAGQDEKWPISVNVRSARVSHTQSVLLGGSNKLRYWRIKPGFLRRESVRAVKNLRHLDKQSRGYGGSVFWTFGLGVMTKTRTCFSHTIRDMFWADLYLYPGFWKRWYRSNNLTWRRFFFWFL